MKECYSYKPHIPLSIYLYAFIEQFVIYQVGLVPSRFYRVLGGKDLPGFRQTLLVSFGLIVAIATVSTVKRKYVYT